jgi:hypothetical protein
MTNLRVYRRSELEAVKPAIDADGCLFRFKKIWMEGYDDSSDVALIGQAFAKIKHIYIERLLALKVGQDAEEAQAAFQEGIVAEQTPSRLIPDVRSVWMFHAEKFELRVERFLAAEERGEDGGVGWAPDLVYAHAETNSVEIIDDKSGWKPPMTEAELKGLFQARVYSRYGQIRWPGFAKYIFTIHAVRFNKSVSVEFTADELDAVEEEVQAAIATIQAAEQKDYWPAVAGPSCHFCTLQCPIADQQVTLPKRLDVQQYHALGGWLLVAEKQLRAAKKLMKNACGVFGAATVNGMVWDNRPSTSVAYPLDAVMEVLKARGGMGAFEDPSLTISKSALAKLFKQFPQLETDLKPFAQEKTSYRFGAKVPGQDDDEEE